MTPRPGDILRRKGGWSPVIRVVEAGGGLAIEKDYSAKALPIRAALAPRLVRREREILRHLAGIPGIPRLLPADGPLRLRTEYIPGRSINKFHPGELEPETYRRLESLVTAMHERRVVHLDLRQRKNILIRDDGRPFVLDFANAIRFRRGGGVSRWAFERLAQVDESALLKYKNRLFPGLLTEEDRRRLRTHQRLRRWWVFKPGRQSAKDKIR